MGGFIFLTSTYCYEHFQIYRKVERLVNSHVSIYEVPLGAVTNGNKFCGLKEHKWIKHSDGQMSEVSLIRLKSRSQKVVFPLEVRGGSIPCFFQLLEDAFICWFVATSLL